MKKQLHIIWYYLSYPLRMYFQEKVSLYKDLLSLINHPETLIVYQARGYGKTHRISQRKRLIEKLTSFINRWDFKE